MRKKVSSYLTAIYLPSDKLTEDRFKQICIDEKNRRTFNYILLCDKKLPVKVNNILNDWITNKRCMDESPKDPMENHTTKKHGGMHGQRS